MLLKKILLLIHDITFKILVHTISIHPHLKMDWTWPNTPITQSYIHTLFVCNCAYLHTPFPKEIPIHANNNKGKMIDMIDIHPVIPRSPYPFPIPAQPHIFSKHHAKVSISLESYSLSTNAKTSSCHFSGPARPNSFSFLLQISCSNRRNPKMNQKQKTQARKKHHNLHPLKQDISGEIKQREKGIKLASSQYREIVIYAIKAMPPGISKNTTPMIHHPTLSVTLEV